MEANMELVKWRNMSIEKEGCLEASGKVNLVVLKHAHKFSTIKR